MQENEKNWGFGLRRGNRDREEKTEEMDRNFNENNGFTGVRGEIPTYSTVFTLLNTQV